MNENLTQNKMKQTPKHRVWFLLAIYFWAQSLFCDVPIVIPLNKTGFLFQVAVTVTSSGVVLGLYIYLHASILGFCPDSLGRYCICCQSSCEFIYASEYGKEISWNCLSSLALITFLLLFNMDPWMGRNLHKYKRQGSDSVMNFPF